MNIQSIAQGLQIPFNCFADLIRENKTARIVLGLGIIAQVGAALAFYSSPALLVTGLIAVPLTVPFGPALLIGLVAPVVVIVAAKILGKVLENCFN